MLLSVLENPQMELEDSININYGILEYIFKRLDGKMICVKQIILCLVTLSTKVKMILSTSSKDQMILKETKITSEKGDLVKLEPDF